MKSSRVIKFGPSKRNENVLVPNKWLIDDVEVTEMEFYGITPDTTLEDIGEEPADMIEFQEWKIKKSLIEQRDNTNFLSFLTF